MNEKSNSVKFKLYPAKLTKEESLQYIINQRYVFMLTFIDDDTENIKLTFDSPSIDIQNKVFYNLNLNPKNKNFLCLNKIPSTETYKLLKKLNIKDNIIVSEVAYDMFDNKNNIKYYIENNVLLGKNFLEISMNSGYSYSYISKILRNFTKAYKNYLYTLYQFESDNIKDFEIWKNSLYNVTIILGGSITSDFEKFQKISISMIFGYNEDSNLFNSEINYIIKRIKNIINNDKNKAEIYKDWRGINGH